MQREIFIKGFVSCLITVLLISTEVLAFDKSASYALSHYIMAGIHDARGETDKAIEQYKLALRKDRENPAIHLNLAASYIKNNQIEDAIKELELAVKFDPESVEPHAILALLYTSQNNLEQAAREYETALTKAAKLAPGNVGIYKSLGAVYLSQKKFQEAKETYQLILDLAPEDAQAHFYLAAAFDKSGDKEKAEGELKTAIELDPENHAALNYLGYLYVEENKNLEEAAILIGKAIELDPDNGAYIDSLGWLYFKQGKIAQALLKLKDAGSLLADPVIYDHLGDAYFKSGNLDAARKNWQESLNLDPQQDSVKEKLKKDN
ncbi:tetratricopeptide repeat protein [Candidatus Omnitrophota bacterium]